MADTDALSALHVLEYAYTRSTGPVVGAFLTGLRDGRLLGAKSSSGRVVFPAVEYDPATAEPLSELVEVGPGCTVTTWAWVSAPRAKHPLRSPFAWALIKPDGADTAMLHAVAAASEADMKTRMRVIPRWRTERSGGIGDIECFEPEP